MNRLSTIVIASVAVISLVAIVTWQATGGDWYTKYEVVEQVEYALDPNDPLAAAGFYEGETTTETITRDEFRFGLLPTPSGMFDKHAVSVASVAGPAWVLGIGFLWIQRRRLRQAKA